MKKSRICQLTSAALNTQYKIRTYDPIRVKDVLYH